MANSGTGFLPPFSSAEFCSAYLTLEAPLEAHFTISISLTLLPATLDRLAFDTRLPAAIVGQATMSLRLKRLVRLLPGNRVAPEK